MLTASGVKLYWFMFQFVQFTFRVGLQVDQSLENIGYCLKNHDTETWKSQADSHAHGPNGSQSTRKEKYIRHLRAILDLWWASFISLASWVLPSISVQTVVSAANNLIIRSRSSSAFYSYLLGACDRRPASSDNEFCRRRCFSERCVWQLRHGSQKVVIFWHTPPIFYRRDF